MADVERPYRNILLEVSGYHARLVLNRPEKLNPLDAETVREMRDAVTSLDARKDLRTVVITGAGDAFSAGGDLEGYVTLYRDKVKFRDFMEDWYAALETIEHSSKIFIAAINGVCVAGGLELVLACDLVIASEDARIGDGHLNFGQLPGAGSSVRLWRAVGHTIAKQLMLTGQLLTAREARALGLIGTVAPRHEFEATLDALLATVASKSQVGTGYAKQLLNQAIRMDYTAALRAEIALVEKYATTETDATEGLIAFKEKRNPRFGGS